MLAATIVPVAVILPVAVSALADAQSKSELASKNSLFLNEVFIFSPWLKLTTL
jgi:hypothetical protein